MALNVIDIRNRPAFLHDFYGKTPGSAGEATALWLNGRTGSHVVDHFTRSRSEQAWVEEIRVAGVRKTVVIGRDTPEIRNDNDEIAALVARNPELVGAGSVDPQRIGKEGAVAEAERAVKVLGLRAINLEPTFGAPAIAFDDSLLLPVYDALQDWDVPVFLMTGPTTPNLSFNDPDAIGRVARAFPRLKIVVHHGAWPRVLEIIGVAFRYPNVTIVPDMYIFQPGTEHYVAAANGALSDQFAFGSSYPFRALQQSIDDYARLGLRDDVLEKVLFSNANRLLGLGL